MSAVEFDALERRAIARVVCPRHGGAPNTLPWCWDCRRVERELSVIGEIVASRERRARASALRDEADLIDHCTPDEAEQELAANLRERARQIERGLHVVKDGD